MKRYILPFVFLSAILVSCGPTTFTMQVDMRGPSRSGLNLVSKDISVLYIDNGSHLDSIFLGAVSEGFAEAIEKDYFGGEETVGIYRLDRNDGADYTSRDTMVNLIMDTGSDVVFLFDLEGAGNLKLFVYDALNPKDSVYRYSGGNVLDRITEGKDKALGLGLAYADIFQSTWTETSYAVVYYENGEYAWQTGAEAAYAHRWKDAIDAWMTLLGTKNLQKRGCAEYNIALACYMLGQNELALEWLDRADEDYFISPSSVLRRRLVPLAFS